MRSEITSSKRSKPPTALNARHNLAKYGSALAIAVVVEARTSIANNIRRSTALAKGSYEKVSLKLEHVRTQAVSSTASFAK